jgi:hypothetical protein
MPISVDKPRSIHLHNMNYFFILIRKITNFLFSRPLFILLLLVEPTIVSAVEEEVLLTFQLPAIGQIHINTVYDYETEKSYLPVAELFNLLEINCKADAGKFELEGQFPHPENYFCINFREMQVTLGANNYHLIPGEVRVGDADFYLTPNLFEQLFGLRFKVCMSNLEVSLETEHALPVEKRKARELSRQNPGGGRMEDYPLAFDRDRALLDGGILDYSLTGRFSGGVKDLLYTFTGGVELLGGDLQGTASGIIPEGRKSHFTANDIRWRYVVRDSKFLSEITAGQIATTGLQPVRINGVSISNDPVEPRRIYDAFVFDGHTVPDSEVEIYINDRLTGYQRTGESGYYRFNIPVSYGTTRIGFRIFTPSGEIINTSRQMQVPFTFLPPGEVSYNLQAGKPGGQSYNFGGSMETEWIVHGHVAMGLSSWLTASVGAQNPVKLNNRALTLGYGQLSARIAKVYLFSGDIAPGAFYRLSGNVIYASNLGINFMYTHFDGQSIFNYRRADEDISAHIFIPINLSGFASSFRMGGTITRTGNDKYARFRTDFISRFGKINYRINYQGNVLASGSKYDFGEEVLTTSITYTIPYAAGLPACMRGIFVKGEIQYDIHRQGFLSSELQLTKSVLRNGRFNIGGIYNIGIRTIFAQIGLTFDLKQVRSTAGINASKHAVGMRKNITGSMGWDSSNRTLVFNNRQQTGGGAASVLLFVDNDNSGSYNKGDNLLPCRAVQIDRVGTMHVGKDSILRLSQLQSYYRYNLSVNRNALPDPTLVPVKDNFSFVTDPNRYKRIEIPFYRGGIAEGTAYIENEGQKYGQGGLRLKVQKIGDESEKTIRTFGDGGFYITDLSPGHYTINVDPSQLALLNLHQKKQAEFEIKVRAEGDYIETLEIIVKQKRPENGKEDEEPDD